MPDAFQYDVFLSHNQADKPRVRRLAERLKAAGVRVWLDEWVIKAGDIIALKVDEGLEQSRVLLLCISPTALASGWVGLERSTAVHRDPANAGRRFIPLLLGDCDLPDTLRRYKYVDFREESDAAFAEVRTACRPETVAQAMHAEVQKNLPEEEQREPKPSKKVKSLVMIEWELGHHKAWVDSVVVSPDGKFAASGSRDKTVRIWDLDYGLCQHTLKGHTNIVTSVVFTPDGMKIISASRDNSVRVWDARSGKELAKLDGHAKPVTTLVTPQDNTHVLSGSWDGTLKLWDIVSHSSKTIECGKGNDDGIFSCAISRTGKLALSGHRDGRLQLWSLGRV